MGIRLAGLACRQQATAAPAMSVRVERVEEQGGYGLCTLETGHILPIGGAFDTDDFHLEGRGLGRVGFFRTSRGTSRRVPVETEVGQLGADAPQIENVAFLRFLTGSQQE